MVTFNPEIRLGDIGFLLAALVGVLKIGSIQQKVDTMYMWFEVNVINGKPKSRAHSAGD